MQTAIKLLIILFGIAIVAMGVKSVIRREAKFSLGDDDEGEQRVVEGFPAVLVGLLEVGIGLFIIFFQRHPWAG